MIVENMCRVLSTKINLSQLNCYTLSFFVILYFSLWKTIKWSERNNFEHTLLSMFSSIKHILLSFPVYQQAPFRYLQNHPLTWIFAFLQIENLLYSCIMWCTDPMTLMIKIWHTPTNKNICKKKTKAQRNKLHLLFTS